MTLSLRVIYLCKSLIGKTTTLKSSLNVYYVRTVIQVYDIRALKCTLKCSRY